MLLQVSLDLQLHRTSRSFDGYSGSTLLLVSSFASSSWFLRYNWIRLKNFVVYFIVIRHEYYRSLEDTMTRLAWERKSRTKSQLSLFSLFGTSRYFYKIAARKRLLTFLSQHYRDIWNSRLYFMAITAVKKRQKLVSKKSMHFLVWCSITGMSDNKRDNNLVYLV